MRLYDILDAAIIKRFITAIAIPENSDLNDYITPGRYYIGNSDIAETIKNNPYSGIGTDLLVIGEYNSTGYITQIMRCSNDGVMLARCRSSSGSWADWKVIAGAVAVSLNSNRANTALSAATYTQVQLNGFRYRTSNAAWQQISNYGIEIPYTGIVTISAGAYITGTSPYRGGVAIRQRRDGETVRQVENYGAAIGGISVTGTFSVQKGDMIDMFARAYDSPGTLYNNSGQTYLDICYA